ncbi:MAG: DUF364 domain-containing protein [Anaerolineae bacterium]|nr:DUF364 domain-containing protein [Anaerolineae bacterium]
MNLFDALLAALPDGKIREVRVGAFWTAVVAEVNGAMRCGLAATFFNTADQYPADQPDVRDAGNLLARDARALAELARASSRLEASIGVATINALLPPPRELCANINAEEIIAREGAGKRVALVGHFPFVSRLRERVGTLWVLEEQPRGDDLPANAATEIIPQADVLALTGTTIINHTFEALMALRRADARVLVLGPSTPLSPILFEYGVDILSGAIVENVDAVLRGVSEGATFRQLHRLGVRLVTLARDHT